MRFYRRDRKGRFTGASREIVHFTGECGDPECRRPPREISWEEYVAYWTAPFSVRFVSAVEKVDRMVDRMFDKVLS